MSRKGVCVLCRRSEKPQATGALATKDGVTAHQNCLGGYMSLALVALGNTLAAPEPEPEPAPIRPEDVVSEAELKDEEGVLVGQREDSLPPGYRSTDHKDLPPLGREDVESASLLQPVAYFVGTENGSQLLQLEDMEAGDAVSVWPRMEPFLLGVLQAPHAKLSLHYLRKMAVYVRAREGCFPRLGWAMWRHIACGKLQLPEDLAWLYFETFDLLIGHTPEERLEWAESLSQCSSPKELDLQRSKLSVDTMQFLLFLHIQQLNRVSLRTSLIGEEWPSPRSPSPCSEREAKTGSLKAVLAQQNWDDQAHLTFVQNHLGELLELLVEPGQLSGSGQALRDSQVSLEALQGLGLLLEGRLGRCRTIHPLHRLLSRAPLQAAAGYCALSGCFPTQRLLAWLRNGLSLNPYGILRSAKKLAWAQQVEGAMKRARMARNTHLAPAGSRIVVMSQVDKQTLAKDSDKLVGANVRVHRCCDAFIYLLSPLRSVLVDKCRGSTVVLGPVETSVHVQACEDVRVVCVAGRVVVGASARCTVHALTPTRPLLLPGNTDLTLGPFHTHYPTLEDHMASVGLAVVPNLWDQPLLLGAEGLVGASPPACYRLLPPAELHGLVVPFQMEGDTCEVPGGLPPLYQAAVEDRERRMQSWQRTVEEAQLNKEQRQQFQALVEEKFLDWLRETGHRQELDSLIPPTPPPSDPPLDPPDPPLPSTKHCVLVRQPLK